jgi:ribose transport system substrate-binding protein
MLRNSVSRAGRAMVIAVALVATCCVMAACGSDSKDDTPKAGSGQASSAADAKPVKVYVLLPSLESDSYIREKAGARAAAGKIPGAQVTIDAGTSRLTNGAAQLVSKIESAVTRQYDVIAVNPGGNAKELKPALEAAINQGVKVITFDQDVPGLTERLAYLGWDARKAGELAGAYIKEQLKGRGEVGVIRCAIGNQLLDRIESGFRTAVKGSAIRVVGRGDGLCDVEKSRTIAENMLTAHPAMKGFFADTDLGAQGAQKALEGANKDLVVTGTGGSVELLADIKAGRVIDATATFPFEIFGREAVKTAVAVGRGAQVPATNTLGTKLATKDNADEVAQEIQQAQR